MVIEDEIVNRILDIIDKKDIRVPEVFCNEDYMEFEDEMRDVLWAEGIEATFSQGASKFVIVPADSDYVIKIPFNFCGDEDDAEYCRTHDGYDEYEECHPFHCNYCDEETEIYEKAKDWEIEDAFSELDMIRTTNTMQWFYVQEKVVPICDLYEENFTKIKSPINISKDSEEKYRKFNCDDSSLNPTFVKAMIEFFGIDFVKQFMDFLYDCNVSDLHDGNYGFRLSDGKPVLFDYGGYHEQKGVIIWQKSQTLE